MTTANTLDVDRAGRDGAAADARPATPASAGRPGTLHRRTLPPALSCVVPCRNEAANLDLLLPRLRAALDGLVPVWEIVLVDDGSSDATADRIEAWVAAGGVRVLQLSRNFGKEAALTAGMEAAQGDVVVLMDADLQHPVELIETFLRHWRAGADVVYALRQDRQQESWFKRIGVRGFYGLLNGGGRFEVPAGAGDFRLMDRAVVDALLAMPERNRFLKGLYAWVGFESVAVPYTPNERQHGRSHFDALRLVGLALDGLTAFTTLPLRAVSVLGFAMALLAFGYGAYLSGRYLLYGNEVSGWTTIVVSLMLLVGIQLISLGVVGEYVGRIFEEVKFRPLYVVKRRWGRGLKREDA
ncbi:glycosyltransferase family 2 protein [Aquabacterium sp.]|uniref:glycosyltransferase family 2 protein n=1 Tax=Aquabacterium sp. TaxID=1872578 RepID=UPI00378514D9